jgi:hypothetical protein
MHTPTNRKTSSTIIKTPSRGKPYDMSGVPRTVAEHHLNVKPSSKQAQQCLISYIGSTTISNLAISINEGNLAIFIGSWEFEGGG